MFDPNSKDQKLFYKLSDLKKFNTTSKQNKKDLAGQSCYFDEMKPLFVVLRAIGRFPYGFTKTGFAPFSLISWSFLYFCAFNAYFSYITWSTVIIITNKIRISKSYDEMIFWILLAQALVQQPLVPFSYGLDAPKTVRYFGKWKEFEGMWKFGRVVRTRRRLTVLFVSLATLPLCVSFIIFESYALSGIPFISYSPYVPIMMSSILVLFCWIITLSDLKLYTEHLIKNIFKDCEKCDFGQKRMIWMKISHLVSEIGCATGGSQLVTMTSYFLNVVLSLHGILSSITSRHQLSSWFWGQVLVASYCSVHCYLFVNTAHGAVQSIGPRFSQQLLHVDVSYTAKRSLNELNLMIKCVQMKLPKIELNGFTTVSRNQFVIFVYNAVTYLIVLVQFNKRSTYEINEEDVSLNSTYK